MPKTRFIFIFAGASFLVGFFHAVDVNFSLEYRFSWFDLIPHTLGGAWLVLFTYFFTRFFLHSLFSNHLFFVFSLFTFVLVAILWEVFEVWYGVASIRRGTYVLDTALDFLFGSLGAICTFLYLSRFHKK